MKAYIALQFYFLLGRWHNFRAIKMRAAQRRAKRLEMHHETKAMIASHNARNV